MEIKPIETYYNGYRFRSRLEARWAVFFDAAGIKYQYEHEGFRLGNEVCYLPDFYLPDHNLIVEIKPTPEQDDGKAKLLADSYTSWDEYAGVLVCYGDPLNRENKFYTSCESDEMGGGYYRHDNCEFLRDTENRKIFLIMRNDHRERAFGYSNLIDTEWLLDRDSSFQTLDEERLKARQARFEHGERG